MVNVYIILVFGVQNKDIFSGFKFFVSEVSILNSIGIFCLLVFEKSIIKF